MVRTIYGNTIQAAVGQPFTATLAETPRPGTTWKLIRLTIEVPNYVSGSLAARMSIAGRFIAGSNNGQSDSYSGGAETIHPSEQLSVTWNPTGVPGIVQGQIIAEVDQSARR